MALTQEDLQAIRALMQEEIAPMKDDIAGLKQSQVSIRDTQEAHTASIVQLENNVMHELKLLGETLPNAIARNEVLKELEDTVDNHDHRIFALEQKASNG